MFGGTSAQAPGQAGRALRIGMALGMAVHSLVASVFWLPRLARAWVRRLQGPKRGVSILDLGEAALTEHINRRSIPDAFFEANGTTRQAAVLQAQDRLEELCEYRVEAVGFDLTKHGEAVGRLPK